MKNQTLFFICGPHCSGKTSIIRDLGKEFPALITGHEIGKEFYYKRKAAGFSTDSAGEKFEFEVADAELSRDHGLSVGSHALMETWHPGNLAYALMRNPAAAPRLASYIKSSSRIIGSGRVIGVRILVSRENISKRTRTFADAPEWAADFYTAISSLIPSALQMLGLEKHTVTVDGNQGYDAVKARIREILLTDRNSFLDFRKYSGYDSLIPVWKNQ